MNEKVNQKKWKEDYLLDIKRSLMIPIYGKIKDNDYDVFMNSGLIRKYKEKQFMKDFKQIQWFDICTPFLEKKEKIEYRRFKNDSIEPFIIKRNYQIQKAKSDIEIIEDFRLLFNLYFDKEQNKYIDLIKDTEVIRFNEEHILVNTQYLKSYLAIKKKIMIIKIDSRYNLKKSENLKVLGEEENINEDYSYHITYMNNEKNESKEKNHHNYI